jgi:spore maturation protein CgeB
MGQSTRCSLIKESKFVKTIGATKLRSRRIGARVPNSTSNGTNGNHTNGSQSTNGRAALTDITTNRRSIKAPAPYLNGDGHTPTSNGAPKGLKIVVCGLSITSSWGNGHATTYRALIKELSAQGHHVLFLERNLPWYEANRDLPSPPFCRLALYDNVKQLKDRFRTAVRNADLVIVGSYVPEGIEVGEWVTRVAGGATAFYDIDTPITISKLESGTSDYLSPSLVSRYSMYLSFTGGPMLDRITGTFGSPMARPLYCSVDPTLYHPEQLEAKWDLGYMGTYSEDRQPALDELLLKPAREWKRGAFVVAGSQYPKSIRWPSNVKRFTHIAPKKHCSFYNKQRFTLNLTRQEMIKAGYSPSVRLFEAAACGTPIISDYWEGLDCFFRPGDEILIANSSKGILRHLASITEQQRLEIGRAAREKVLRHHTSKHRAMELVNYTREVLQTAAK